MVVMIVEDSPTMRQLICHALRRIDKIVLVEAEDGNDALAKLAEIKPDVLVTDINMPKMDGFELIAAIRERADMRELPVVVMTTAGAAEHQDRAKDLGVAGFVTKPVKPDAVVAAVLAATRR